MEFTMFSYLPSLQNFIRPKLEVCYLPDYPESLSDVIAWSKTSSPGFIAGDEKDEHFIRTHQDKFYLLMYGEGPLRQVIGMFALLDVKLDEQIQSAFTEHKIPNVKELNYVYLAKNVRGLGMGSALVKHAKQVARNLHADVIVLDTLTPALNQFYIKNGATVICENRYPHHEENAIRTSVLRINLS